MAYAELKDDQAYIGFTLSDLRMMRDEIVGKGHHKILMALLMCVDKMIEQFEKEHSQASSHPQGEGGEAAEKT